jgi:hypothetical protein
MTPVLADNAAPTNPAAVANTGFRLGEEQQFSDSDSDQSQTSQRSLSPTPKDGEVSKSKRRKIKERRAIAALGEELVDVLGGAFSAPNADSTGALSIFVCIATMLLPRSTVLRKKSNNNTTAPSRPVNTDQSMVVDSESTGKKMSKTTCVTFINLATLPTFLPYIPAHR